MKKIIIITIAMLTVTPLLAKPTADWKKNWKFGVTGGVNLIAVENYGGGAYAYFDHNISWQAGIKAQYKWGKFLSYAIEPELKYVKSSTTIETIWGPGYGNLDLHYIDLPVNFQFGLQLSPIFRPFIFAGVNLSYLVKAGGEYNEVPVFDHQYNKFNFGLGTGVGFDLWKFQLQCKYNWGLTRVENETIPFENLLRKGWEFSLSIMF